MRRVDRPRCASACSRARASRRSASSSSSSAASCVTVPATPTKVASASGFGASRARARCRARTLRISSAVGGSLRTWRSNKRTLPMFKLTAAAIRRALALRTADDDFGAAAADVEDRHFAGLWQAGERTREGQARLFVAVDHARRDAQDRWRLAPRTLRPPAASRMALVPTASRRLTPSCPQLLGVVGQAGEGSCHTRRPAGAGCGRRPLPGASPWRAPARGGARRPRTRRRAAETELVPMSIVATRMGSGNGPKTGPDLDYLRWRGSSG